MSTRTPKAWETSWAQDAIKAERDRPADRFEYGEDEGRRVAKVKRGGAAPKECSDAIVPAPARPGLKPFREVRMVPVGSDDFKEIEVRYMAGCAGQVADVFDDMARQGARRGGLSPFTVSQVATARSYRALYERVESAGVSCSRAFDVEVRSGNKDFLTAYMDDRSRLRDYWQAIGDLVCLSPRRQSAHSMDRSVRRAISDRTLVDRVCLQQQALSDVLKACGWSNSGKTKKHLQASLCAALERMRGI